MRSLEDAWLLAGEFRVELLRFAIHLVIALAVMGAPAWGQQAIVVASTTERNSLPMPRPVVARWAGDAVVSGAVSMVANLPMRVAVDVDSIATRLRRRARTEFRPVVRSPALEWYLGR